ncbi:uncharacterized protein LOC123557255 [Mercenaria mercenaria]|uniref:uncharacterized protein LOC123557255 n=1 Tax=Mercenaria mercenaria TaxID=6596 RepID=UPI00234F929F|nr:uncharacterized protein LOC123557255 [Mercenaria mercenaria]
MLRSVRFKNFVHFKEEQFLDFQGAGPFIFIGENGAGKSSVLEGIRRCLKTELSTSVSSSFENDKLSYFICIYETDRIKKGNDAGSLTKKNDADPLKKKNETNPLEKETDTDQLKKEKDTDPLKKDYETAPLTKENETGPFMKENETDPLMKKNEIDPLMKKKKTDPLMKEEETDPFIKKYETDSLMKENETDPSLKENETNPLMKENGTDPSLKENETNPLMKENGTDPSKTEYVICGFVVIPDGIAVDYMASSHISVTEGTENISNKNVIKESKDGNEALLTKLDKEIESERSETGIYNINENTVNGLTYPESSKSLENVSLRKHRTYYKFSMYYPERNEPMQKHLLRVNTANRRLHVHAVKTLDLNENVDFKQKFIDAIFKNTQNIDEYVEPFLLTELNPAKLEVSIEESENEDGPLDLLTNRIVFTFPLRSIGPLQWSESERIRHDKREENYAEAEKRCEIIKSFLKDRNQTRFDRTREHQIFNALTKSDAYVFDLSDDSSDSDSHLRLNGEMFALLKAPEGILEAKAFSILMSGKQYKTIILEEPDRGMHPQLIERMVHLIKQCQSDKRVILTTHNTAFISPWSLSDCFVFRRTNKECCIVPGKAITKDTKKPKKDRIFMKKLRLLTSDHLSDILFAKKVLFCEGDSDFLFLTELKHQILSGEAKQIHIFKGDIFDYTKLEDSLIELTIIKMNSKDNTGMCQTVSKIIKLDAIFLLDKATGERKEKHKDEKNVFFWEDGDIEDMIIEMCKCNDNLITELSGQNVTVNPKKLHKTKNPNEKLFLRDDVTIANVRTAV